MTSSPLTAEAPAPRTSKVRGRRRRRLSKLTRWDVAVLSVLLAIPALLSLALIWATTAASIGLSFTSYNGVTDVEWIGTRNYTQIVTIYEPFWGAVRNNLLWLAVLGVIATPLGLFFAFLLDKQIRFTRFYQSVFYMPVVLSLAVVGFIAQLVYSRDHGALNVLLGNAEHPTDWLGDPKINIWAVLVAAVWRHTGYVMILYLAGLKAVDPALKEAAALDGANERQLFFRVVFPTLRPINIIVLVITVIEALRAFDIVYAINSGRNGLELLSVLVTQNIVGEASRIGFGSAIAVILLTTSIGFVVVYLSQIIREERQ
ncbi:sugar ABC transporter permease [Dactylosporangium aurantiacum]|uniref:Sugar ABC transporter permease n=1 Tax=Dactylosporangium aurantiacum TaxID=35754 RepID=A0A9Q9IGU0_9ACTN|nr:sugar ABC transporter permease [Dactylosporangium aurantiacum]MDG6101898.1 sugar ABC transporter permease [Dactylosporangium aurantiacum]UWZ52305.1 sugar ABC transporter permease [Dactylosporangium aurantiacum]